MNKKIILGIVLASMFLLAACNSIETPNNDDNSDPLPEENRTYCGEDRPDVCVEVYDPVCGDNQETYGNGCKACADSNVSYHVPGECSEVLN